MEKVFVGVKDMELVLFALLAVSLALNITLYKYSKDADEKFNKSIKLVDDLNEHYNHAMGLLKHSSELNNETLDYAKKLDKALDKAIDELQEAHFASLNNMVVCYKEKGEWLRELMKDE